MEEIGNHFKFEKIKGSIFHNTNLLLSSGRNCLRYIIKERDIKKLYLPFFLCESLSDVSNLENIKIIYYHIDENYLPIGIDDMELNEKTYLYLVNYYGILRDRIKEITYNYKYVIVDNTHDFFDKNNYNTDVIYNYRKYFGVPDGACIVSNNLCLSPKYTRGVSLNKIIEMVSRDESGEFLHYPSFFEADKYFQKEGLKYMSNFTENYIKAIDYNYILNRRILNYQILHKFLSKYNEIDLDSKNITYMFPLFVSNGDELRRYLGNNNIYSLMLWPNVDWNNSSKKEIELAHNMVLLPIDQRYSEPEMEYIINKVDKYYNKSLIKK